MLQLRLGFGFPLYLSFFLIIFIYIENLSAQYQLTNAFPNLPGFSSPIDFQNAGDCTNRVFVVEQSGIIKVFENDPLAASTKTFLNITDRVTSGGELGLLGAAFHPDYKSNGYFYVNYTAPDPRRSVISRFQVSSSNPDSADKNTELILFTQNQPFTNHNGGQVAFGPDGYLYIALGDGGSGGDPQNNGQTLTTLLGKILRIDVDNPENDLNYGIPTDNPFKDNTAGYKEEIFAYGLRNPWRFSFDPVSGRLWCGDVGQNDYEEINVIENGKNYGWRCYEGNHPFNTSGCSDSANYTFPIWEYPRSDGYSITGGYVYRGPNQPGLYGKYIYADYGSDKVWALTYDAAFPPASQLLLTASGSPVSFGIDEAQELYICTFGEGRIYKFVPTAAITAPAMLTAEATGTSIVSLNWSDQSNNESGFRIERMEMNESYSVIADLPANTTSYNDTVLQAADYKYRVNAYNSTDISGYSNDACVSVAVVPVELTSFTAGINKDKSSIILKWETASESNNLGFEIERSFQKSLTDNSNWAAIAFVEGNGTTTEKSLYSFIDNFKNSGFNGKLMYRLKQVNFDGTFDYSDAVAVDIYQLRKDYHLQQNYPNPFNPSTNIRFNVPEESKIKIDIINSLGEVVSKLVDEIKQPGFYDETWNANNFSSGVYYVRMNAESLLSQKSYYQTIKMIYLK